MSLAEYFHTHRDRANKDTKRFLREHVLGEMLLISVAAIAGAIIQNPQEGPGLLIFNFPLYSVRFLLLCPPPRFFVDSQLEIPQLADALKYRYS